MKTFFSVFSFTFARHTKKKGYLIFTAVVALLLLLLPAAILPAVASGAEGEEELLSCHVKNVYVLDQSETAEIDWNFLSDLGDPVFESIEYTNIFGDLESAKATVLTSGEYSLLLWVTEENGKIQTQILVPNSTALTSKDTDAFDLYLTQASPAILWLKSGADLAGMPGVLVPIYEQVPGDAQADPVATVREVLQMVLPYLNIMVLYFMILIYGQGVSNSVIMEKNSKLMDTFLVYVPTDAMIFGKVIAIALSAILQLTVWVLSLAGGFGLGASLAHHFFPTASFGLLTFLDSLSLFGEAFSLPGIFLGLLAMIAGFFLYCAIASIGGSLASKQEDLASTQSLFTLILVAGFLLSMFGGFMEGTVDIWMLLLPVTAVFLTPAHLMLGTVSIGMGVLSVVILLLSAGLLMWVAGKIYHMTAFYRGKPLTLRKLFDLRKR